MRINLRSSTHVSPFVKRVIFVAVVFAIFTGLNPAFANYGSILSIIQGIAFVGIASVFLVLLITAGEFDISIGANAALSALTPAILVTKQGYSIPIALLITIAVGASVGLLNGLVVIYGKVPSFIATIAMLFMCKSLATYISEGKGISDFPDLYDGFKETLFGQYFSILVFIAFIFVGEFILNRTNFGKVIAAVGSNPEAARTAGINANRVKLILFVVTGCGAALAGFLSLVHFNSTWFTLGSGWELLAIAGLVIGGTSLFGGRGTVIGLFLGLLLMQVVASGMVASRIDPWWQTVITGVIVLVSLSVDMKRKKVKTDAT
jgi:ribose transport system permease protein